MELKSKMLNRLRRIEGQVRGIERMIEDDRYCIDVITQLQAVRAAVSRAESELVKQHVADCVRLALAGRKNEYQQREKAEELIRVLVRPN